MKNEKNNSSLVFLTFSHSFMFPQSSSTRAVKLINSCWKEKLKKLIKKITIVIKKVQKQKKKQYQRKSWIPSKLVNFIISTKLLFWIRFFLFVQGIFRHKKRVAIKHLSYFFEDFFSFQEQCFFQHVGLLFGLR